MQALTGKEQQSQHAYEVSGRGCRISRVGNIRSNMPTMYQVGAAGSPRVGNYRSYMPARHQEETSGSHWFETPDRTCLLGVRTALHDFTGSEHKIVHAYKVSGRGCRISRVRKIRSQLLTRYQDRAARSQGFGIPDRTPLPGIRTGLQDLTGSDRQIQDAYKVSGRGCRTSRVRHIRSNLPTRYQVGVAGPHGLGTTDRPCRQGIRRILQDLTGSKHQIERAY